MSVARSRALVASLPLDRELVLVLPRVRLAVVRFAELRLEELDDLPREREDRARLAAAEARGLLPSPPLSRERDAPCADPASDAFRLDLRLCDVLAARCVAVAIA